MELGKLGKLGKTHSAFDGILKLSCPSKAANRFYKRKNKQAKRRRYKKFTRQQKVSIKTIKSIATKVAKRLDKKKVFNNWIMNTLGTYSATTRLLTALRPIPSGTIVHHLMANQTSIGDPAFPDFRIPRKTIVDPLVLAPDLDSPARLLIHQRESDTVYIKSITFRGQLKLPSGGVGSDKVRFGLWKTKVLGAETPTLGRLNNSIAAKAQRPAGANGYTETDDEIREDVKSQKLLKMKQWSFKNTEGDDVYKDFVVRHVFKKPLRVDYDEDDFQGSYPRRNLLWFSFTATGLNDDPTTPGASSGYSPHVGMSCQINYFEK